MLFPSSRLPSSWRIRTALPGDRVGTRAKLDAGAQKAGRFIFVINGGLWIRVGRQAYCVTKRWGVWLPPEVVCFEYPVMSSEVLEFVTTTEQSAQLSADVTLAKCPDLACRAFAQWRIRGERASSEYPAFTYISLAVAEAGDFPDGLAVTMPSFGSRLTNVCDSVLQNPNKAGQLDRAATTLGVTVRTLGRLFQEELGISAARWRRNVQIATACCELDNGTRVSDVAQRLGYGHGAFSTLFRSRLGYSPRERASGEWWGGNSRCGQDC
jgi:AraC-like DNA-binding protein